MKRVASELQQLHGSTSALVAGGVGSGSPRGTARRRQAPPSDRGPVQKREAPKPGLFRLAKCHWLTASFDCDADAIIGNDCEAWCGPLLKGSRFFGSHSWEHETGAAVYFSPDQGGCVLNVPGECWDVRDDWLTLVEMLRGKITRIDLAVDVGPVALSRQRMMEMRRAWLRGAVETKIRTFSEQRSYSPGEGFTWYFGGKTADVRLRAYDRRGPLRLEFQWRPDDKHRLLAEVIAKDVDCVWRMLASGIRFPLPWFVQLLRGDVASFVPPREQTDVDRVAQALRDQWGETLWALSHLGMSPESFLSPPADRLRSSTKSKFKRWAFQSGDRGAALLAALELH